MNVPTPRIFDKKRSKRDDTPTDTTTEDVPMIVYRETRLVDGVQEYKIHTVPVADWDNYAKEHGL
jgi:hypothetical protein